MINVDFIHKLVKRLELEAGAHFLFPDKISECQVELISQRGLHVRELSDHLVTKTLDFDAHVFPVMEKCGHQVIGAGLLLGRQVGEYLRFGKAV